MILAYSVEAATKLKTIQEATGWDDEKIADFAIIAMYDTLVEEKNNLMMKYLRKKTAQSYKAHMDAFRQSLVDACTDPTHIKNLMDPLESFFETYYRENLES